MKKSFAFISTVLVLLFTACKREKETAFIATDPSSIVINAIPGEVLTFRIKGNSDDFFDRLVITAKEQNSFTRVLLDTALIPTKNVNYRYELLIREVNSANNVMNITFTLYDKGGRSLIASKDLIIAEDNYMLREFTGLFMHSKRSGQSDAYDLIELAPLFSGIAPASIRDIQIADDKDTTENLSLNWVSPAGWKFVKTTDMAFNYPKASKKSAENAYEAGTPLEKATDLKISDILITKIERAEPTFVVIRITEVSDKDSTNNDRFTFNIKK